MNSSHLIILTLVIFLAAVLYSSVGHGGASAYLAAMALFGISPAIMKPTALILNILVAGIGTFTYCRAKAFSWSVFWPFTLGSIPLAYLASRLNVSHLIYNIILGVILVFTGCWILFKKSKSSTTVRKGSCLKQIIIGAAIGFLAGLTGIGGGVLLSPLLILTKWADTKKTSGVAAAFIFVNSIAGIIGHLSVFRFPPGFIWLFVVAAVTGGTIGSTIGAKHLKSTVIQKVLGVIMLIAGVHILVGPLFKLFKKKYALEIRALLLQTK